MLIRNFNKILFAIVLGVSAQAEYRVYQYMVSSRLTSESPASVIITSTLDPNSYVMYHGGNRSIRVNLMNTWLCKGHTGNKPTCAAPMAQLMNVGPQLNGLENATL